ncbi:hypothetical protein [Streptomyces sp. NPDC015130]|uniref:hypothetical protein n=1 Tax=Streptomyces sp. NPDC015130 TaxID=3364940 RepID=UPI0036FD7F23
MGNTGGTVTTRYAGDLPRLMRATGFAGVDGYTEHLAGGWQVADFADAGRLSFGDLVRRTGAPAVMVSFLDSDVGFAEALTPDGISWEGLLNRRMAKSYEIPLEHFPIEPAVAGSLAWATAVGLAPDEEAIRRTLTGTALFAEELCSALLVALGLPGAPSIR